MRISRQLVPLLGLCAVAAVSSEAMASTITQNVSWTIDRAGTTAKYRVVGYGDSIYAGYRGSISSVAKRSGPQVEGEYAAKTWNTDVEVIRRAKSGALASDIYNNKIVAERSYMQAASTRVVTFEMCGNDFLQARSNFAGQSGTCVILITEDAQRTMLTHLGVSSSLSPDDIDVSWTLGPYRFEIPLVASAMEFILDKMKSTKNNHDFFDMMRRGG